MNRRGFLKGLAAGSAIVAAPALIREGFAMPVREIVTPGYSESDIWRYGIDNTGTQGNWESPLQTWGKQEALYQMYTREGNIQVPACPAAPTIIHRSIMSRQDLLDFYKRYPNPGKA